MRVPFDLAKATTSIVDLSNVINPRVGDGGLPLAFHITDDGQAVDMRNKDIEFLSQDENKQNIYVSGTMDTSTSGDSLYEGNVTFKFPEGTFKTPGTYDTDKTMFRIVNKDDNSVISTVNVKLTVLPSGDAQFNFDPDSNSYNSRLDKVVKDFQGTSDKKATVLDDKIKGIVDSAQKQAADIISNAKSEAQSSLDEIKQINNEAKGNVSGDTAATAQEAKKLANKNEGLLHDQQEEIGQARGTKMTLAEREDAQDNEINRKEDRQNANANYAAEQQRNNIQDAQIATKANLTYINDYLSKLMLNPIGAESGDQLKKDYPNGNPGFFVTQDGHKWLYFNNQWNDCGVFQSAGIANGAITTAKTDFALHQNNLYDPAQSRVGIYDIDNGKVVYKDATVNAKYAQLTCFKFKVTNEQRTYTVSGTDFNVFGSLDDGTLAWSDDHSDGVDGPYTFTVPVNVVWVYVTFNTGTYTEYEILPGNLTFDQTGKFMLNAPLASPLADGVVTPEMTNFFYDVSNLYDPDKAKTGIYNVDNNKIVYEDASVNSNYANLTCFKFRRWIIE